MICECFDDNGEATIETKTGGAKRICGKKVESHEYFDKGETTKTTVHTCLDPDPIFHPYEYMWHEVETKKEGKPSSRLTLSYLDTCSESNEEVVKAITAAFGDDDSGPKTEDDCYSFLQILSLMHPHFFADIENSLFGLKRAPRMTPAELCRFAFYDDDRHLLKYVYALATGETEFDMEKITAGNTGYQSQYLAVFVAMEMLARINSPKVQRLQMMMSDQLDLCKAPRLTRRAFTRMRLSADEKTLQDSSLEGIYTEAIKGVDTSPYDFVMYIIDNLGFRMEVGYDQWTIILVVVISFAQLCAVKIYSSEEDEEAEMLSRDRKNFQQMAQDEGGDEALSQRIIGPTGGDTKFFTHYTHSVAEYAMRADVPSYEQCQRMATMNVYDFDMVLNKNLGVHLDVVERTERKSTYDQNNMTVEPYHGNLSLADVVEALSIGCMQASNNMISRAEEEPESRPNGINQEPIQSKITAIVGDAAPVYQWCQSAEEREDEALFSIVKWFFGGLHFQMEMLGVFGKLFQEGRGDTVFSYRNTIGRWNWIMYPRDPTDALNELIPYLVAHYRAAADCLAEHRRDRISPAEVLAHMNSRAADYPLALYFLMEIRFAILCIMIRDSEKSGKKGNPALFIACMRLSLPFLAVSNSYRYVKVLCQFLSCWETSSEAEKKLFTEFIYTRISPYGLPIWSDRCIEWTMGHIRDFMGKFHRPGHDSKMYRAVPEISWRKSSERGPQGWKNIFAAPCITDQEVANIIGWNEQTLKGNGVTEIYALFYVRMRDLRVWDATVPPEDDKIAEDYCDLSCVFRSPRGGEMDKALLNAFPEGLDRAKAYFQYEHLGTGEKVKIDAIPCTAKRTDMDRTHEITVRLSTDPTTLKKVPNKYYTKHQIIKEAKDLQQQYPDIVLPKDGDKKDAWIEALCEVRELYFASFVGLRGQVEDSIREQCTGSSTSTQVERAEILQSSFFVEDEEVLSSFSTQFFTSTIT